MELFFESLIIGASAGFILAFCLVLHVESYFHPVTGFSATLNGTNHNNLKLENFIIDEYYKENVTHYYSFYCKRIN